MAWFHTFNAVFWMSIGGGVLGVLALIVRSKCRSFQCCWGGFVIERDIRAEVEVEEFRLRNRSALSEIGLSVNSPRENREENKANNSL